MRARPVLLLLLLLLAACGTQSPSATEVEPVDPTGSWRLTSGTAAGAEVPILDDHPITLTIEGSELYGTAACNEYGGRLAAAAGRLDIGEIAMTAMACGAAAMDAEAAYMRALDLVDRIRIDAAQLVLGGGDSELRFERLPDPPTAELLDTVWGLESIFVGDVAAPPLGERATLELRSDGTLRGSTGCRGFTGTWVERGPQIVATTLAMDDRVCPPDLAQQDGHVVTVIGDGFVPSIEGGLLTLSDPGGVGLSYRAIEP